MRLLTILFLLTSFLQVNAQSFNDITIKKDRASLETVFLEIEKQSEFRFFFNETLMKQAVPVTIDVKKVSLNKALETCFEMQPKLTYAIVEKTIIVKRKAIRETEITASAKDAGILNVKGKVNDEKDQPIPKASVSVKGTRQATATDSKGEFELKNIEDKAILIVSNIGYQTQEIPVDGKETIFAQLKINVGNLDEAVVVAYNTTTMRRNTGAVTVVKGEDIQTIPNRSFDKSLQGFVPGLLVSPGSGQPGGGVGNFVLRGVATNADAGNFSTVRNPLIIIDGVPATQETSQITYTNKGNAYGNAINNPLAQINPSDIESISILKDAAAIALYGAKSSNGVIIVTTKRGKSGKPTFGFRHQTDIAVRPKHPEMLSPQEYFELVFEAYKNADPGTYPDDAAVIVDLKTKFPTRSDGSFYPHTDWHNELFKRQAITFSNEIFMSGGNERSNYYLNLEYTKQDGVRKKTSFDRKSLRFNFENRPTDWLKLSLNSTMSYNVQNYDGSSYQGDLSSAGSAVLELSPLNPIRLENGDYYLNFGEGGAGLGTGFPNPVAQLAYNKNRNTAFRGLARLYGEIGFLKYFKITSSLGVDFMLSESKEKNDIRLLDPIVGSGGRIEQLDNRVANFINTNILSFDKKLNDDHRINLVFGQEAQILNRKVLDVIVTGMTSFYYDEITSPGVTVFDKTGYTIKETLLSYFSQLNYDFKNRYFITGSIRRDGSSRFGADKRFGTYWSTGAGWVISSEPFMSTTSTWLNFLKIRGSIGAAGNAGAIDRYTPYDRMGGGLYLDDVAVIASGSRQGNPDVKWENTLTWDAGLEVRLFKERIALTADIYSRKTSDLIYELPIATNSGFFTIMGNLGTLKNDGLEFSMNVDLIKTRNFSWTFNANYSRNKSKLLKIGGTSPSFDYVTKNQEGESFNSFYLIRWAGVNSEDGNPQWIDSTGQPNSDYFAAKPERVGKSQPDAFGAVTNTFKYNGFELMLMFYYQFGYQIYNTGRLVNDGLYPYANQSKDALNRWQKPGDNTANPRRIMYDPNQNLYYGSTRYLFDGDHIRLQNVLLSYTRRTKMLGVSSVKFFIQGNNLALWTTKSGSYDPGGSTLSGSLEPFNYPIQKSFSIGINANF